MPVGALAAPVGVLTRTVTSVPDLVAELAIVAGVVVCFVVLHAVLQRRLRSEMLRRHNDVAGFLFSAVGVLYAVVLGFVVVVVWQKYDNAVSNVENEVDAVANLYHVVDAFPGGAARARSAAACEPYARTSLRVEWPAMNRDQAVPETGAEPARTGRLPSRHVQCHQLHGVCRAAGGDRERSSGSSTLAARD